jgi:hypothetical protein
VGGGGTSRGADVLELRRPRVEHRARQEVVRAVGVCGVPPALTRAMLPCGGGVSRIGAYVRVRMRMQRLVPAFGRHAVRVRTD